MMYLSTLEINGQITQHHMLVINHELCLYQNKIKYYKLSHQPWLTVKQTLNIFDCRCGSLLFTNKMLVIK